MENLNVNKPPCPRSDVQDRGARSLTSAGESTPMFKPNTTHGDPNAKERAPSAQALTCRTGGLDRSRPPVRVHHRVRTERPLMENWNVSEPPCPGTDVQDRGARSLASAGESTPESEPNATHGDPNAKERAPSAQALTCRTGGLDRSRTKSPPNTTHGDRDTKLRRGQMCPSAADKSASRKAETQQIAVRQLLY